MTARQRTAGTVPLVAAEEAAGAATTPPSVPAGVLDSESQRWLDELATTGRVHDDAVRRLHELLLRAARYEVSRRRDSLAFLRGGDHDDIAQQAADDALLAVMGKLDTFRGDSRFTTWIYKFALYEAAVKLRRRLWQDRELTLDPEAWPIFASPALTPDEQLAESELLIALRNAITGHLSVISVRCSSRLRSTASRSTCSPSGSTRPAARCTRPCTTRARSCAPS